MAVRTISVFWIEDQLDEFIESCWQVLTSELAKYEIELKGSRPDEGNTFLAAEIKLGWYATQELAKRPSVIVLDLMLPQDDEDTLQRRVDLDAGYLIWFQIRHLKKWLPLAEIPIIVITARGRPEYMDQMCADPLTRWIPKPADPVAVAEGIVELFGAMEKGRKETIEALPPPDPPVNQTITGR
jgi:CheY-like chemotaxis protein